jgi:hypothetical protein
MTTKTPKKEDTNQNKSGAEKPISLWGASFQNVLKALLKTKPIQKDAKKQKTKTKKESGG